MSTQPAPAKGARRELGAVVVLCAAGGALALLAAGRTWVRIAAPRRAPLPDVAVALSGRELEPLVPALGLVGLAGVVGLLATRRWGRLVVGVLLAAAGVGVTIRALGHLAAPGDDRARDLLDDAGRAGDTAGAALSSTVVAGWPLLAAAGGLLLAAGGLGVVLRSRRWPTMSARYERAAPRRAQPAEPALWDALDAGTDPTAPDPAHQPPRKPAADPARDSADHRPRAPAADPARDSSDHRPRAPAADPAPDPADRRP